MNVVLDTINISKVASLILSFSFIVFSFTYGNALYEQEKYKTYRLNMIAEDLADLECVQSENPVQFQMVGNMFCAEVIENMPYGVIKKLLLQTSYGLDFGSEYLRLQYYYGFNNLQKNTEIDFSQFDLTIVVDNSHHKIELYEQYVLITIK